MNYIRLNRIALIMGIAVLFGECESYSQTMSWEALRGPYRGAVLAMTMTPGGALVVCINEAGMNHLYRSSDHGENWSLASPGIVRALSFGVDAVHQRLYMGTEGSAFLCSSDDGCTWVQAPAPESFVTAILVLPSGELIAGTYSGIYRSDSGRQHWNLLFSVSGDNLVGSLSFTPWGSLLIGTYKGGAFISPDSGITWNPAGLDGKGWTGPFCCTDGGVVLAGSNDGLYRSTDRGTSWNRISPTPEGVHAVAFDKAGRLLIGINGRAFYTLNPSFGLRASTDNGSTWEESGLGKFAVVSILVDPDGDLFAGTDGGVHRSTDDGKTWRSVGITGFATFALASLSTGTIFAGDDMDGAVYRSTNQGDDWSRVAWGLYDAGVRELAVNSLDHLFASVYSSVFRTTDEGASWEPKFGEPINQITFNRLGYGYAASLRDDAAVGGVFRSTDNGGSWVRVAMSDFDIYSVVGEPPFVFAGTAAGLYRSTDQGETWFESDSGMASRNFPCVYVDTCQSHPSYGWVYAGTAESGIFYSRDNGLTWSPMNSGLKGSKIRRIIGNVSGDIVALSDSGAFKGKAGDTTWTRLPWGFSRLATTVMMTPDRRLFVAPLGDPLQRSNQVLTALGSGQAAVPPGYRLMQNFPNPFNPSTIIRYSMPGKAHVNLSVFNTLGQLVATLVDEIQGPGACEVRFDGSGLASGVYFYRLRAGTFVQSKKLLILR